MTAMRTKTLLSAALCGLTALAAPLSARPGFPVEPGGLIAPVVALPLAPAALHDATTALTPVVADTQQLLPDTALVPIPAVAQPAPLLRPLPMQRPAARDPWLPAAQWDDRDDTALWTRATLAAVRDAGLADIVPDDIATWCPEYLRADEQARAAFWVGLLSALARYESTHNPRAVGGGGLYYGLLQILPSTARQYGCTARSGDALRDPEENLACAVRIAAPNIIRDNAVARLDGRNAGIARDWGPMTQASKREVMAAWTSSQAYCTGPAVMALAPDMPDLGQPAPLAPLDLASLTTTPDLSRIDLAWFDGDWGDVLRRVATDLRS
jgi:hypothetical protein